MPSWPSIPGNGGRAGTRETSGRLMIAGPVLRSLAAASIYYLIKAC